MSPYGYDSGYASAAPALAPWGKRALAGLIDYAIPSFVIGLLSNIFQSALGDGTTGSTVVGLILNLALIGFMVWNTVLKGGSTGVSLGRQIAKTRLISEATGQPIGPGMALVRHLAHIIDSVICYIGWLFPLWDAKRQTLADKIVKTVVVEDNTAGTTPLQQGYNQ